MCDVMMNELMFDALRLSWKKVLFRISESRFVKHNRFQMGLLCVLQNHKLLRETCELVGFFYLQVQDDGLKNLLDRVFHQSKQFFALPANVKKQFSDPVMTRGYTAMGEETLDPSHQMKGDTKEGYYLAEDVSREDPRYNPDKFTGPNIYPTNIQGQLDGIRWKETMMEYHEKMKNVCFQVIQLLP